MQLKTEWIDALLACGEKSFIADEKTKRILWSNCDSVSVGDFCHEAFFCDKEKCGTCPDLTEGEVYSWERYDKNSEKWVKIKYLLFKSGNDLLRAGNINVIDEEMRLTHDSVEEISCLNKLLSENSKIKALLEREATVDNMTKLFNRNKFNLDLSGGIFGQAHTGVMFFDINNLKIVNDTLKHEAGDILICTLAESITATSLFYGNATAYRIGGDEFVLCLRECSHEKIDGARDFFEKYLTAHSGEPKCEVAVGYAYSDEECDGEALVTKADNLMYEAKRKYKESLLKNNNRTAACSEKSHG